MRFAPGEFWEGGGVVVLVLPGGTLLSREPVSESLKYIKYI